MIIILFNINTNEYYWKILYCFYFFMKMEIQKKLNENLNSDAFKCLNQGHTRIILMDYNT